MSLDYVAGFLDADGCITYSYGRYRVIFTNSNEDVLKRIQHILNAYGIPSRLDPKRLVVSRKADVKKLLQLVVDKLTVKRRQARLMLAYFQIEEDLKRMKEVIRGMNRENKKSLP